MDGATGFLWEQVPEVMGGNTSDGMFQRIQRLEVTASTAWHEMSTVEEGKIRVPMGLYLTNQDRVVFYLYPYPDRTDSYQCICTCVSMQHEIAYE